MIATVVPSLLASASAAAAVVGAIIAYFEFHSRKAREVEPDLWVVRDPKKYMSSNQSEHVWTLQVTNHGRSPARNARYVVFTTSHVARDTFGGGFVQPGESWEIVFDRISSNEELQGAIWCQAIDGTWYGRDIGGNRGVKYGRREPSEKVALHALGLPSVEQGLYKVEGWSRPLDVDRAEFNTWIGRLDEAVKGGAPPEAIEQAKTQVLARALILGASRRSGP